MDDYGYDLPERFRTALEEWKRDNPDIQKLCGELDNKVIIKEECSVEDEYFVLWKSGKMQGYTAVNKMAAMKLAKAYKRVWNITYDRPIKALTEEEAAEYRKAKYLCNMTR